jgi:NADH-quinone oxidoreductase subunit L
MELSTSILLTIALAPLVGCLLAGFFGKFIGRAGAHSVTILGLLVACGLSFYVLYQITAGGAPVYNHNLYTWFEIGKFSASVGFLVDRLTAMMMVVVTFVSLLVHVYTIGYMADDPGYQRFFSYISLFTFSMLMLVMSNNFMQLFFGWEAVGLVSYLLIGFCYKRPTAIFANLKAFLVNRVGDFGFLLGIAAVLYFLGTMDYATAFSAAPSLIGRTLQITQNHAWDAATVICVLLFIGAMGKSAQVPLHVWLPDSMEGPTPISALIHAATMVTAGIFMVARMSPLYELSSSALSFVMVIGATGALFTGLIGIVQNDIKRVVAYSTLSQLGYMTVALGVSAYSGAVFHLMTHAFFKALLFLGAGSVIIAMHHEQDMRKMGGLRKYMPITYATMLIGALANAGLPPFAGFFSKDSIIEAVHLAQVPGAHFAYYCALAAVFVGGLYSFRLIFFTFHGKERFREPAHDAHGHDAHHDDHGHHGPVEPHESPKVVTVPLILLSIPAIASGWLIGTILYGNWFGGAITIAEVHQGMATMAHEFHGIVGMMAHGVTTLPFWLAISGAATAWYLYIVRPDLPAVIKQKSGILATILEEKYGFDRFNDWFFAGGARLLGRGLWKGGDQVLIDGVVVNGSAAAVGWISGLVRLFQTGRIYQYAFGMIFGVFALLSLWFARA